MIATYERSLKRLSACIDLLLDAGGTTTYDVPGVMDELPDEVIECTPLGYALRFQDEAHSDRVVAFLRERGAMA